VSGLGCRLRNLGPEHASVHLCGLGDVVNGNGNVVETSNHGCFQQKRPAGSAGGSASAKSRGLHFDYMHVASRLFVPGGAQGCANGAADRLGHSIGIPPVCARQTVKGLNGSDT
jgi:hypothetical protein